MKKIILLALFIAVRFYAAAEPVDEDRLFSDDKTVVENVTGSNAFDNSMEKKSFGISGQISGGILYSDISDKDKAALSGTEELLPYMLGNLYLDARTEGGYKGFGSFELIHDASSENTEEDNKQTIVYTRELFVDFNISNTLYFRAGKQVLQWGQCYLWNPTDMINVERKSFIEKIGSREGTNGIKLHIPFGTSVNIYGFADLNEADSAENISGAGKFEFLIMGTEIAFSAWGKKEYHPVYGCEFSTRVFGFDMKGEGSFSHGSNTEKIINTGTVLTTESDDNINVYRGCVNIGRDFRCGEKTDNLNISLEFFYNGDGYDKNPIEDHNLYLYDRPVIVEKDGLEYTITGGERALYLFGHDLYNPNYFSKYYAALFITFREFVISELTLKLNAISNINQKSGILSTSLGYTNINNFNSSITADWYTGSEYSEYRISGTDYSVQIKAGIIF